MRGARRAPDFVLRRGRRADLPAVEELAAKVLPAAGDASGLARYLDAAPGRLWVASAGASLMGFLLAQRVEDEVEILWMGVAAAARRTGMGRALIEAAATETPLPTVIVLEVRAGNAGARAFYAALGFREDGVRGRYYPGGEDAIRMSRRVDV
ncbi:MAG: GNAT family N-acetyltransferase [bacterium]|nr:GNAT family N-acetyltransferase [bacterium]MCP5071310.1 GNAT family N-acetyltransferase [bacterium]